jgi:hypothetical protein
MRIYIDNTGTPLAPELRGWLAKHLDAMNTPAMEILEARVTCRAQPPHSRPYMQMQVELLLVGQTLCVVQVGTTLTEAAQAALHALVQQLRAIRLAQQAAKHSAPGADSGRAGRADGRQPRTIRRSVHRRPC